MRSGTRLGGGQHGGWTLFFEAVGAIAAVAALLQAQQCTSHLNSKAHQINLRHDVRASLDIDSVVRARQQELNRGIRAGRYEAVYVIREQKGFVDPETGFAFRANDISTVYPSFLGPDPADGILCFYQLPDGKYGPLYRRGAGERIDFMVHGRRYFAAIEDVDYKLKVATIRIRETSP
jgi:hypothetical protein